MSNKRKRRSRRGQLPSLEREMSASEAEVTRGNGTMIDTLNNFDFISPVSSVSSEKWFSFATTQNENEMQVWAKGVTNKTKQRNGRIRKRNK